MTVTATIDIAAPPSVVRAKFLDFASLPKYHSGFFGSITPLGALEPGNKIRVHFAQAGQTMDSTINANKPEVFTWTGSIPFIFTGAHSFLFEPSTEIPGGCRFTQSEEFSGALGWMMGSGFVAKRFGFAEKTKKSWDAYNADLKRWCEEGN